MGTKAHLARRTPHLGFHALALELGHGTTLRANQELGHMRLIGAAAGGEGIQALDAMDKALGEKEVESPINGWRRRALVFLLEDLEDIIGSKRPIVSPDQFQHPSAKGRKADATVAT